MNIGTPEFISPHGVVLMVNLAEGGILDPRLRIIEEFHETGSFSAKTHLSRLCGIFWTLRYLR